VSRRPLVLHITGDYPDPSRTPTTVAVKQLIDNLTDCDHIIISLTRTADPRRRLTKEFPAAPGQRLFAIHHFGLPFGAGLQPAFHSVARQIERLLDSHGLEPDMVHAHRLTFDGIAGWLISRRRSIPHVVSIRGEVESKVLRYKPTYRPLIRRILEQAHRVYYVSAWFRPELERLCPGITDKSRALPNIVANTRSAIMPVDPQRKLVAVANLDIYQKKGIDRLITAFARAAPLMPDVTLDIIGGGKAENVAAVEKLVAAADLGGRISLRGALPNGVFLAELPRALALALPSRNETFGMVYTEALFAGVPILYSRNTGIDGHLEGLDVGIGVPSDDIGAIADGLVRLVNGNAQFRSAIAAAAPELYARFDPGGQVARYMADLEASKFHRHENGADRALTA
jgi:glycosyltransferase involved in cell wall biosynthesis